MSGRLCAGLRLMSRPLFVSGVTLAAVASIATAGGAQDPVRPWLDWRTVRTPNYRFHYLAELGTWTHDVAARVEAIDSAVAAHVGWSAPKPVNVVVDDPFILSNGYALPFLDKPVTVLYATPADPRNDIGNYRTWGELLAVHEVTHLAHLGRPSRNPLLRALWSSLPVNLGPITLKSPRWLYEGYATVIEGRITRSGRPNNAWRPAILRQWAVEGRLPTYGQLTAWDEFTGAEFAYLGGSAFIEWLMNREGDSSAVHLWRRMSARQNRTFDVAFRGVYGDSPAAMYGLHMAELTRDAMAAKATLERAGIVEGDLVQRLSWATGDPAISPDGERVAITLRERDRPSRLVVWSSSPDAEDTAAVRKRIEALMRDPQDVPDRRFHPVAKKAERTLLAENGRGYQMPRWFADNRRVLATRWTARSDGTQSPALYVWDTQSGDVRRVTAPVGVLHADPHPNATEAVAMQCHWGHCDIVHVDLERGAMRTLYEGTPDRTYYRPRYAPDGARFVASVLEDGRWKLLVSTAGGRPIRTIDPADGANRYDAQWLTNDTLVVTSERGGIPNLEAIPIDSGLPRSLTRVIGAAVGADVNRADRSLWFLTLHSRGFDVRRLPADAARADSAVLISSGDFGFTGTRGAVPVELPATTLPRAVRYNAFGEARHQRWLPGGFASADGAGALLWIYAGDIIGRFTATATGAMGESGSWMGGAVRATWRHPRPHLELGAHAFIHEPSSGRNGRFLADTVDASLSQGLIAFSRQGGGEWWQLRGRLGGSFGRLSPRDAPTRSRTVAFTELGLRLQQVTGARGLVERLLVHASYGHTDSAYQRIRATLALATVGRDMIPIQLSGTVGRVAGPAHPFERFVVGGSASPVMDSSLISQRYAMPWLPTGIAGGNSLLAWRAALPGAWTLFYEGASTAVDLYSHRRWHRAIGVETSAVFPSMPVAFVPRLEARGGAAYTLDAPFRKKVRLFLEMRVDP